MKNSKYYAMFVSGALSAALVMGTVGTALAASGKVEFNFSNVALNGEKKITAGQTITAPNGQQVPGTILYVDAAGGKTNYLPIRAVSDLLGTEIGYDPATKTILLGEQTTVQTLPQVPQAPQSGTLTEKDLRSMDGFNGGLKVDGIYYINTDFGYSGDALESVTFTTNVGKLALQRRPADFDAKDPYIGGPNKRPVAYGQTFEEYGQSLTLSAQDMAEKTLVFWGAEAKTREELPANATLTALVTFKNGQTQTVEFHRDMKAMMSWTGETREDSDRGRAMRKYYQELPLDQCELVQSEPIKDTFIYTVDGYTGTIALNSKVKFDGNGDFRMNRKNISGSIYLPTLHKNADGSVEGRLYRVPQELEYRQ